MQIYVFDVSFECGDQKIINQHFVLADNHKFAEAKLRLVLTEKYEDVVSHEWTSTEDVIV